MTVPKILLFYAFTPLVDPEAVRLWQRDLGLSLGLGGRIILSKHGINGTVGGDVRAVKMYLRKTREYAPFRDIDVKWSEGTGDDFPRLSVRVREELVSFGAPDELTVAKALELLSLPKSDEPIGEIDGRIYDPDSPLAREIAAVYARTVRGESSWSSGWLTEV